MSNIRTIPNIMVNRIISLGYGATEKLNLVKYVAYCYPMSPMADFIGKDGYYIGMRSTELGKPTEYVRPIAYSTVDIARESLAIDTVLNYLASDTYSLCACFSLVSISLHFSKV